MGQPFQHSEQVPAAVVPGEGRRHFRHRRTSFGARMTPTLARLGVSSEPERLIRRSHMGWTGKGGYDAVEHLCARSTGRVGTAITGKSETLTGMNATLIAAGIGAAAGLVTGLGSALVAVRGARMQAGTAMAAQRRQWQVENLRASYSAVMTSFRQLMMA